MGNKKSKSNSKPESKTEKHLPGLTAGFKQIPKKENQKNKAVNYPCNYYYYK
jgi:hypothetical protein